MPIGRRLSAYHRDFFGWFDAALIFAREQKATSDAYAAIEAKQIPAPDSAAKRDIINRFTNVLYDLTRRGLADKIGHGPGFRSKIAPRDPELL